MRSPSKAKMTAQTSSQELEIFSMTLFLLLNVKSKSLKLTPNTNYLTHCSMVCRQAWDVSGWSNARLVAPRELG